MVEKRTTETRSRWQGELLNYREVATASIRETTSVTSEHPDVLQKRMQDLPFARRDIGSHNTIGTISSRRKKQR